MISTPIELATYLWTNRQTVMDLVKALIEDIQGATDAIMDILDEGYDRTDGLLEVMKWEADYKDYVANPVIEVGTAWFLPLSDGDYWDATIDLLRNIGVLEPLADSFKHYLVIECLMLMEEKGKSTPDSSLVEVFGTKALEALETWEQEGCELDHYELIAAAAPRIAEWAKEIIESEGAALALYATLKLIFEESNQ